MIIHTSIDTEAKTVAVWTDENSDYYVEWHEVEFDSMDIQEIVNDVKERIKEED